MPQLAFAWRLSSSLVTDLGDGFLSEWIASTYSRHSTTSKDWLFAIVPVTEELDQRYKRGRCCVLSSPDGCQCNASGSLQIYLFLFDSWSAEARVYKKVCLPSNVAKRFEDWVYCPCGSSQAHILEAMIILHQTILQSNLRLYRVRCLCMCCFFW